MRQQQYKVGLPDEVVEAMEKIRAEKNRLSGPEWSFSATVRAACVHFVEAQKDGAE